MNEIKRYKPQNCLSNSVAFLIEMFVFVFLLQKTDQTWAAILVLVITAIMLFVILNRRVVLYNDYIEVANGIRRHRIKTCNIQTLEMKLYTPFLSKISIPALIINYYNDINKIITAVFPYKPYTKDDLSEILIFVTEKNQRIEADKNIKLTIKMQKNTIDTLYKKINIFALTSATIVALLVLVFLVLKGTS